MTNYLFYMAQALAFVAGVFMVFKRIFSKRTKAAPCETVKVLRASEHGISNKLIHKHALDIVHRLQNAGFEAYIVGGSVRDLLVGLKPKDFDIATSAKPEQVKRLFSNARIIGRRFKLVHIYYTRDIIEVATFRGHTDAEEDGHRRVVSNQGMLMRDNIYGTLEQDALRRDLTVNSLYYDPAKNIIVDYVGGFEDIKLKQINLIGEPMTRYKEDPMRMIRALRFASKLGFALEKQTRQAIGKSQALLKFIPAARLFDEYQKLFLHGDGVNNLAILHKYRLLGYFFPTLSNDMKNTAFAGFVNQALVATDLRAKVGEPINPGFLLAGFLWPRFCQLRDKALKKKRRGQRHSTLVLEAMDTILKEQHQSITIPRRLTDFIKDIWFLQYPLEQGNSNKSERTLAHLRFRAGHDFLVLREQLDGIDPTVLEYWEKARETRRETPLVEDNDPPPKRRPRRNYYRRNSTKKRTIIDPSLDTKDD